MIRPNLSIWLIKPTPEVMLMGMQFLFPTFSVLIFTTDPSVSVVHAPTSLNFGNRSFGTSAGFTSSIVAVVLVLLLIRTESGDVAATRVFLQARNKVIHKGQISSAGIAHIKTPEMNGHGFWSLGCRI